MRKLCSIVIFLCGVGLTQLAMAQPSVTVSFHLGDNGFQGGAFSVVKNGVVYGSVNAHTGFDAFEEPGEQFKVLFAPLVEGMLMALGAVQS